MRLNIFGGLRPFRPREAGRDALAGVTLASMNIPQVLGYTRIAGTPVVTGLYTVLLPLIAFARITPSLCSDLISDRYCCGGENGKLPNAIHGIWKAPRDRLSDECLCNVLAQSLTKPRERPRSSEIG